MGLSNYKAPSHEVVLKDGSAFEVRGLSLSDVSLLIQQHLPDIEALFDLLTNTDKITGDDLRPLAGSLVAQAPGFAANVIALAAGEPDAANTAATLPFPIQVEVITKIGDLTFAEVGGVKKALGSIVPLLASNKAMLAKVMVPKAG
jgi:hypothetical protein